MSKPTDQSLHDFARNPGDDETYDARKAVRWLFEAVTGTPMGEDEAAELVEEAVRRHKSKGMQ